MTTFGVPSSAFSSSFVPSSPIESVDNGSFVNLYEFQPSLYSLFHGRVFKGDDDDDDDDETHTSAGVSTATIVSEGLRAGWPAILTLLTRDQYGQLVHVPNLKVTHSTSKVKLLREKQKTFK